MTRQRENPIHIPMVLNDSVENHLEYFKTRGRDAFQIWMIVLRDIFLS